VSQSHEPSYYEIALTNRQVLIVFVVLLICVVAAFFSGVWVGHRDTPAPGMALAQGGTTEPDLEAEEGGAVGELHFFSDEQSPAAESPSLAEIADAPQPETTLLEDLGGRETDSAAAVVEPGSQATASKPDQADTNPALQAPPPGGGYVIQVFSSADEVQARNLLKQLTDGGYPAFLSPVEVGSQTMVRVRIGPFSQLANAETVADRIQREFKLDTWVTQ
jgi:cell division septation protein DedD